MDLIIRQGGQTPTLPESIKRQMSEGAINDSLFIEYVTSLLLKGKKPQTVKTYANNLLQFFKHLKYFNIAARSASQSDILSYFQSIKTRKPHTVKNYIGEVKRFYGWYSNKYQTFNPAKEIQIPTIKQKYTKDIVLPEAVKLMMQSIKDRLTTAKGVKRSIALRDAAILQVMIKTGLREISIVNLNVSSYSYTSGVATLRYINKGGSEEKAFPSPSCIKYLNDYISDRGAIVGDEPLFISYSNRNKGERLTGDMVWKIIRALLLESGAIPLHDKDRYKHKITPHSLRHTFGTFMYMQHGQDSTQGEMAHASGDVTRGYAKLAVQYKRLRMDRSFLDEIFD